MASRGDSPTFMRLFGRMVGRVGHAVTSPAPKSKPERPPARREVSRSQEAATTTDAAGNRVTLRRTTIEEIEVSPPQQGGSA